MSFGRAVPPMIATEFSHARLAALRQMEKTVENPRAHWPDRPGKRAGHRQRTFRATGADGSRFTIFQRRSPTRTDDFSCGLRFHPPGARPLILARYNGGSHIHGEIEYAPHIHRASKKAIETGKKPESRAEWSGPRFHWTLDNERWLAQRRRHRSPAQVRRELMPPSAAACLPPTLCPRNRRALHATADVEEDRRTLEEAVPVAEDRGPGGCRYRVIPQPSRLQTTVGSPSQAPSSERKRRRASVVSGHAISMVCRVTGPETSIR